jgi:hypothetical protein
VNPGSGSVTFTAQDTVSWLRERYGATVKLFIALGEYKSGKCHGLEGCSAAVLGAYSYTIK